MLEFGKRLFMRTTADRGVIILNFERGLNFEFRMEALILKN
jgi:hypothetical protein